VNSKCCSVSVALFAAAAVTCAGATALAQQPAATGNQRSIGSVNLETSCDAAAQVSFQQGAALLHSFVWEDARRAFQTAAKADPACAMAYWGEAMSYYDGLHDPPSEKAVAAAREALTRATAAAKATERERLYVAAGHALFDEYPRPARVDRDRAHNQALRVIRERFPDDEDASALYALSLLAIARRGVPDGHDLQMQAAKILEGIFAKYPQHPGAAHYLIHAYDDSGERERGLAAARAYARIAPAVTHALHMPSHIFAGLGMWDETIASNEAAFAASDRLVRERGQPLTRRYYHGVLYWLYALIQKGDEPAAQALLAAHRPLLEAGDGPAKEALHNLLARWYLDTDHPADAATMPILVDEPLVKGEALFVRGLGQVRTLQLEAADATLADLRTQVERASAARDLDVGVRIRILDVQAKQLEAAVLAARGRGDEAVELLQSAVAIEDAPGVSWAPPDAGTGIPAHEFLAETLLQLGRSADAAKQFEEALKKTPGRRRSVVGLRRAQTDTAQSGGGRP
jgi:hypothetical protein